MSVNGPAPAAPGHDGPAAPSGGLLDLLNVAAVLREGHRLLLLSTDGPVETRDRPVDERRRALLGVPDDPHRPLEETCAEASAGTGAGGPGREVPR